MSALVVLAITGIWMATQYNIALSDIFSFSSPIERVASLKLLLLLATIGFAISAQTRVIPTLSSSPAKLPSMAAHAAAEIGRASCRERVWGSVGGGAVEIEGCRGYR